MGRVKDKGLMTTIVLDSASGVSTEELAAKTGKHPETIRRYKRSAEFKAFEGRYLEKIDNIVASSYKTLLKAIEGGDSKIAMHIWNALVPKTIGGQVKGAEEGEETESASLDEFRELIGGKEDNGPEAGSGLEKTVEAGQSEVTDPV